MKKKYLKPTAILCLIALLAIGGTLAYLTDETETVTNTFTAGDGIDITLAETVDDDFTIVPGTAELKDPVVTLESGSAASYIYIDVIESDDLDDYVTYTVSDVWTQVTVENQATGTTTYVYTNDTSAPVAVTADDADTLIYILTGSSENTNGEVTYGTDISSADLTSLGTDSVTLSFIAYAIQEENILPANANTAFLTEFKSAD